MSSIQNKEIQDFQDNLALRNNDLSVRQALGTIMSRKNLALYTRTLVVADFVAAGGVINLDNKDSVIFVDGAATGLGGVTINLPQANNWGPNKSPVVFIIAINLGALDVVNVATISGAVAGTTAIAGPGAGGLLLVGNGLSNYYSGVL